MKKIFALALAFVLVATAAIGGTTAYLTAEAEEHNTATAGKVQILQSEYERVVDDNGNWVSTEYGGYGYENADALQPYTQNKVMVPAVGSAMWDDRNGSTSSDGTGYQQVWAQIGAPGSNQLFDDSFKNVHDKFVFVQNTGTVDCYYRTWIAVEAPAGTEIGNEPGIMTSCNANARFNWDYSVNNVEIDGINYYILVATHTEVLKPGDISRPSLLQVYMQQEITSEQAALYGEQVDILVFSQAVQADGFESASDALNAAFGEINAENIPWNK